VWFFGLGLGFEIGFAGGIPRENGFGGKSMLSADVFPRQGGFDGFSDCGLSGFSPPKRL